jgi:adenylate cyclase
MSRAPGQHRLAAVLSTDVVGYSALMSVDQDLTDRVVREVLDELAGTVSSHGGSITTNAGDGFIAVYNSAVSALDCAVTMADVARQAQVSIRGERLKFRTGLAIGEIIDREEGAFGDAVNLAKRLEQISDPEWTCVSSAFYEQVKNKCAYGFEYLGRKALKNLADPIDVYRVLQSATAGLAAPAYRSAPLHAPTSIPSIAVLPFADLTEGGGRQWLCDGISEQVIAGLSRFRDLFVISRASSFIFRDRQVSVREIGRELGVQYLLDGSIHAARERLRISIRLTEVESAKQAWADTLDEKIGDLLQVEDKVTSIIAGVLRGRIEYAELRRLQRATVNESAYSLLLRAKAHHRALTQEGFAQAERLCREAVAIDGQFSAGWSFLSEILSTLWRYSPAEARGALLKGSEDCARRALLLDEADAQAHGALGGVFLYQKKVALSIKEYEHALKLNPNDADVMAELADAYAHAGRAEEGVQLIENAMRLNPFFPDSYLWNLADAHFALERYEDAIATVNRMHNPAEGRRLLAASLALLGKISEAQAEAAEILTLYPNFSIDAWSEIQPDTDARVLARFVEGLRLAGLPN